MKELDALKATGHYQSLAQLDPNTAEAFLDRCVGPRLEELEKLRELLFNDPSLSVMSYMHAVPRLCRALEMLGKADELRENFHSVSACWKEAERERDEATLLLQDAMALLPEFGGPLHDKINGLLAKANKVQGSHDWLANELSSYVQSDAASPISALEHALPLMKDEGQVRRVLDHLGDKE